MAAATPSAVAARTKAPTSLGLNLRAMSSSLGAALPPAKKARTGSGP